MAGARRIERLLAVLETAVLPLNDAPTVFWTFVLYQQFTAASEDRFSLTAIGRCVLMLL